MHIYNKNRLDPIFCNVFHVSWGESEILMILTFLCFVFIFTFLPFFSFKFEVVYTSRFYTVQVRLVGLKGS